MEGCIRLVAKDRPSFCDLNDPEAKIFTLFFFLYLQFSVEMNRVKSQDP